MRFHIKQPPEKIQTFKTRNIKICIHFPKINKQLDKETTHDFKQNYFTVPFRVPPRYNPRRRSGIGWGTTISSRGPPSPCPSEHPFSSASSSLSEGSSGHRSHEDDISIVTGITYIIEQSKLNQVKYIKQNSSFCV